MTLLHTLVNQFIGWIIGALFVYFTFPVANPNHDHKFVVTDMVQCRGNICNAVLQMDDIAILLPYDSTKVHKGDILYITK